MAVGLAGSRPAAQALSASLRDRLRNEPFQIVTSIRGLPLGVRDELQTLFGTPTLDIAEPGAKFRGGGGRVDPKLPTRRLAAAGCSMVYCLVYYERGGAARTWHVALFHWTPDATRLEFGGTAPEGLATIDDVRGAILTGAIKEPPAFW
jgi:hypothetical protein